MSAREGERPAIRTDLLSGQTSLILGSRWGSRAGLTIMIGKAGWKLQSCVDSSDPFTSPWTVLKWPRGLFFITVHLSSLLNEAELR